MSFSGRRVQVGSVLIICLLSSAAVAQSDCSAEISEIDRRISTGNYSAEKVQMARQIQSVFKQMCPYLKEGQLANMEGSIEAILPILSKEERQAWLAERSAKRDAEQLADMPAQRAASAKLKAERDARKRAARKAEMNKPPVSRVLLSSPTARSLAAEVVVRSEIMNQSMLWDWDVFGGKLRVLYSSFPNTAQFGLPDWRFNVYLAEITPAGEITNSLITSKQAGDHSALMLRRGYDEILFRRAISRPREPVTIERWSITGRRMLSSVDITDRVLSIDGETWRSGFFPIATSDGNILFVARKLGSRSDNRARVGWFKFSPDDTLLGSGTAPEIKDNFDLWSMFHTSNGGAGLVVNISPYSGTRLKNGLGIPAQDAVYANGLSAQVINEKRALMVESGGNLAFMSTAIERTIMPGAPSTATPVMAVKPKQVQTASLETRFAANRTIAYSTVANNVGPHRIEAITETDRGYAFLTVVNAGSNIEPPVNGPYLIEFNEQGETNKIYLEPIAANLNIKLVMFTPSPDGRLYVYGYEQTSGASHVILIDREGKPIARSRTSYARPTKIAAMRADASGVWLLGQVDRSNGPNLWLERIEFRQDI